MPGKNVITVISTEEAELLRLNSRVLDESPDLIAIVDTGYRYVYVNPAYVRAHGRAAKDFIGRHVRDFLGDEVFETVVGPNIGRCLGGRDVRYEGPFKIGESVTAYMDVRYLPLRGETGDIDRVVIVSRDISEIRDAQMFLERSMEFLFNVLNTLDDPLLVKDEQLRWAIVNDKLCQMLGRSKDDLIGITDYDVYPESQSDLFKDGDRLVLETGEAHEEDMVITWRGDNHTVSVKKSLFTDSETGNRYIAATFHDVTERKKIEQKLAYIATHDTLSGLPNRLLFREHLSLALNRARRTGETIAMMMLDLDGFKTVNDTLGHDVGDLLLKETAVRLKGVVRQSDTVARMGGDEFMVLLTGLHQSDEAEEVAAKILDIIETPCALAGKRVTVSASIGISLSPDHGSVPDELIRFADAAMYAAKRTSKNMFCRYEPGMTPSPRHLR